MADKKPRDEDRQEESRRILERLNQETEPLVLRATTTTREHLTAREARDMDWTELWGRRIGRILSVIFAIGLIAWLIAYFLGVSW